MDITPIQDFGNLEANRLFIKRDDLIPYSFGGNKVRKAFEFFRDIEQEAYDCVVTYGSGSSNHCRVISNLCAEKKLECIIVSPVGTHQSFNGVLTNVFGARVIYAPVSEVHDTIEALLTSLKRDGRRPYFIPGGGHGNLGTKAYVKCYEEICFQEKALGLHFDRIFFASGTGTTQAGLVCGHLLERDSRHIIGISIARENPRGREVVLESIRDYLGNRRSEEEIQQATVFVDDYTNRGYGIDNPDILRTIKQVLANRGLPLDPTYTGKAFHGMIQYVNENKITDENILFIHTGGLPLFFDVLLKL